jgi:CheY-like chemotaxis protein
MTENNYKILVIDDMSIIHDDFRKILLPTENQSAEKLEEMKATLFGKTAAATALPPFQIDFAYQGEEGVRYVQNAIIEKKPYAVAFVDVQMPPGMDGVEAIERIWRIDQEIQIVICTAYTKYSWEDLQKRLGDTDRLYILKKPFDSIEILNLASTLTKKWNINKSLYDELLALKKSSEVPQSEGIETALKKMNENVAKLKNLNTKLNEQQRKNITS